MTFDDNNAGRQSDSYSLKTACDIDLGGADPSKVKFVDNFGKVNRPMMPEDILVGQEAFTKAIIVYYEFPKDQDLIGTHYSGPQNKWLNIVKWKHNPEKKV